MDFAAGNVLPSDHSSEYQETADNVKPLFVIDQLVNEVQYDSPDQKVNSKPLSFSQ